MASHCCARPFALLLGTACVAVSGGPCAWGELGEGACFFAAGRVVCSPPLRLWYVYYCRAHLLYLFQNEDDSAAPVRYATCPALYEALRSSQRAVAPHTCVPCKVGLVSRIMSLAARAPCPEAQRFFFCFCFSFFMMRFSYRLPPPSAPPPPPPPLELLLALGISDFSFALHSFVAGL